MKNEVIYMDNKEQKITSDVEQSLPQLNKEAEKKDETINSTSLPIKKEEKGQSTLNSDADFSSIFNVE